jgi:hypothetical protein
MANTTIQVGVIPCNSKPLKINGHKAVFSRLTKGVRKNQLRFLNQKNTVSKVEISIAE